MTSISEKILRTATSDIRQDHTVRADPSGAGGGTLRRIFPAGREDNRHECRYEPG